MLYEDVIHVLNPATGRVVREIAADPRPSARDEPADVAVGHRGTSWYMVLGEAPATLWEFFGTETVPTRRIRLPGFRNAGRIAVSPDDRFALISEYFLGEAQQPGMVAVVNLETGAVGRMAPCPAPYAIAFNAANTAVAVSCPVADEIVVMGADDFAAETRFQTIAPEQTPSSAGNPVARPMGIAWSPGGDRIFAALYDRASVGVFTPQGDFIREIRLDGRPVNLLASGTGRYVVAVTREEPAVVVVDTRSGEARKMVLPEAEAPHDVVLSPDGRVAYVAWEGSPTSPGGVSAVDLDAGEILWTRETGPMTTGIAYRTAPVGP